MTTRSALVFGALLWLALFLAAGQAGAKSETMQEMLERRIAWITEHYPDLEWQGELLPEVRSATLGQLQNMADAGPGRDVQALYDHHLNAIWLRDDIDPEGLEAAYIIIHELVHFLQQLRKPVVDGECLGAREPEAYEAQFQFQEEFGPYPPETNWMFVYVISDCRRWE